MLQIDGGGMAGFSKEVTIDIEQEYASILPIDIFQEIRKCPIQSKNRIEELCKILRRNKIKMTPNFRSKLNVFF